QSSDEGGLAPLGGEIGRGKPVAELGVPALAHMPGRIDQRPGVLVGEERLEDEAVQAMATALGAEGAEDGSTGKGQVTDSIERLVTHEFVAVTKAFAIDDAVVADGDGVFEGGAERQARGPEPLHILHEAKGAGSGKFPAEGAGIQIDFDSLTAYEL